MSQKSFHPERAGSVEAEAADTLRVIACGSVDAGKSTLVGRLLDDRRPPAGDDIAFAPLRRRFIVAEASGHAEDTPAMAAAASNTDLAILVVDASTGLLTQTRRHAAIVSLLGIRDVVLAVNKMDLVGFDEGVYRAIVDAFREFTGPLGFRDVAAIPLSASAGDNIATRGARTPWHRGPTLLDHLESVVRDSVGASRPFRLAVQRASGPNETPGGLAGTVASGRIGAGDEVVVAASGRRSRVKTILVGDRPAGKATAGQSVLLTLGDEIGVKPGDVLASPEARPQVSDQFAANLIWLDADPLLPGRQYLLRCLTQTVPAQVTELKYRLDADSLEHNAAKVLERDEIGFVNISTGEPITFDPYQENRATGAFVLIDRFTDRTVAAGTISFALRRASNIHWQAIDIDRSARAHLKQQKPTVLWFTGLSGSGKSTIANIVEKKLFARGRHTAILDGDNVRHGLNRDLGFTDADRVENIRRVAETAKLMADAGLLVLVSFISPFRSERAMARDLLPDGEFVEIFVDTPIELCQSRDPKGLYARAAAGEIKNFTGIDSPYEAPIEPDLRLPTADQAAEDLAERVLAYLDERGRLSPA